MNKKLAEDFDPTPKLVKAVQQQNSMKVKLLLNNKHYDRNIRDWKDKTALHYACELGQNEIVSILIKEGADIEAEYDTFTPLTLAAAKGKVEVVNILIEAGAHLDTPTRFNENTALAWATLSGHTSCVDRLLKAGAETKKKTALGCLPIELTSKRHPEIKELYKHYEAIREKQS
mmetsp:Transcript_7453/g.11035  ORF Transcript_7453/g.11035 Transcript_7453/m.11035 type:complete len:174 (+) Transcript_7453:40-561(+)